MQVVTKAIFPVAGLGTRFLPMTKAIPKEMLPIVDKPLIQYAVEEALTAGITELVFIINDNKSAIKHYFADDPELEAYLIEAGKTQYLEQIREIIPKGVKCSYVEQHEPLGLGDAVLKTKAVIGDAPFAVLLPDDLIENHTRHALKDMLELYTKHRASVIAVQKVPRSDVHKYGIVSLSESEKENYRLHAIVEKPTALQAPSQLAVTGRYVLTPEIFNYLEKTPPGKHGELQLTDAISRLLNSQSIYCYPMTSKRYDCGTKLGYVKAIVAYALQDESISEDLSSYLSKLFAEELS